MAGRFGSVVTAMVTPFRPDHGVDLDGAQELASWLTDNGSDSVFVVGSTGESPTLSHNEKADLFRAVGEAVRGKGKMICGTGTYSAETLELTQAAEDAGAGIVVVTPYYNKPPRRGLVAHFEHIADATELPIIVYNIPSRTGPGSSTRPCSRSPRAERRRRQGLHRRLQGDLEPDLGSSPKASRSTPATIGRSFATCAWAPSGS